MKLQFNRLVVLFAATVFGGVTHATLQTRNGSDCTSPSIESICRQISGRPELVSRMLTMSKFELEHEVQQGLTNGEFASIHQLLQDLALANAPAEYVEPHHMVLGAQEISGGGF